MKIFKEKFSSQSPLFNSTPLVFTTRSHFGVFSQQEKTNESSTETPDSTIMFSNAELEQVSFYKLKTPQFSDKNKIEIQVVEFQTEKKLVVLL